MQKKNDHKNSSLVRKKILYININDTNGFRNTIKLGSYL